MSNFFSGDSNLDDLYHRALLVFRPPLSFFSGNENLAQRYVQRGPVVNSNFEQSGINFGQIFGGRITTNFNTTYHRSFLSGSGEGQNEGFCVITTGDGGNGLTVTTEISLDDQSEFDSYGISNLAGSAAQVRFIRVSGVAQHVGGVALNTWLGLSEARELIIRNLSTSFQSYSIRAEYRRSSNFTALGNITFNVDLQYTP